MMFTGRGGESNHKIPLLISSLLFRYELIASDCQKAKASLVTNMSYSHLKLKMKFLGAILVHPVRRQNFAGTGAT